MLWYITKVIILHPHENKAVPLFDLFFLPSLRGCGCRWDSPESHVVFSITRDLVSQLAFPLSTFMFSVPDSCIISNPANNELCLFG